MVVREKDIRKYYESCHCLEDICSPDYADYLALKRILLERLSGK